MSVVKSTTLWAQDLASLHAGAMTFERFSKRHAGIVRSIVQSWARRAPEKACPEDLQQEVLITIWRSVDAWDPAREVPLDSYVRNQIRFKMLGMTDRLVRGRFVETTYLEMAISQADMTSRPVAALGGEHLKSLTSRGGNAMDGSVEVVDGVHAVETVEHVRRSAALLVGSLPADEAQFVANLLSGVPVQRARTQAFRGRTDRSCKKRALAARRGAAEIYETQGG